MNQASKPHFKLLPIFDFPNLPNALCQYTDPELFHPEQGESSRPAKSVCRRCDEQLACLQWALDRKEADGVWGGFTPRERKKLKKGEM